MIFPTAKNSIYNLIISNEVEGEKIVPGKHLSLTSPIHLKKKLRMTSSPTGGHDDPCSPLSTQRGNKRKEP